MKLTIRNAAILILLFPGQLHGEEVVKALPATRRPAASALAAACLEATRGHQRPAVQRIDSVAPIIPTVEADEDSGALPAELLLDRCRARYNLAFGRDIYRADETGAVEAEKARIATLRVAATRDCEQVARVARLDENRSFALEILAREAGSEDASLAIRLSALERLNDVDPDRASAADLRAALALDWYRAVWGDLELTPEQRVALAETLEELAGDRDYFSFALGRLRQAHRVLMVHPEQSAALIEVAVALAWALRESSRFDEGRSVLEQSAEELARRGEPLPMSLLTSTAALQAELGLNRGAWVWYQQLGVLAGQPELASRLARILAEVLVVSGKAYRGRNGWCSDCSERAIWLLDQAFPSGTTHPDLPETWKLRLQLAAGKPDAVAGVLRDSWLALSPSGSWVQGQSEPARVAEAEAVLQEMLLQSVTELVDVATGMAKEELSRNQQPPRGAKERAELALRLHDEFLLQSPYPSELNRLSFLRGKALLLLGRPEEASAAFALAWELTPAFELDLLGIEDAVRLGADADEVCENQAAFFEAGEVERTRIAQERMKAILAWAQDPRIFTTPQTGPEPLSAAEEALIKAARDLLEVEADPAERDDARYRMGVVLHRRGRWAEAFEALRPLIGRPMRAEDVLAVAHAMLDELENLRSWEHVVVFVNEAGPWVAERAPGDKLSRRLAAARLYAESRSQDSQQAWATLSVLWAEFPEYPVEADDWLELAERLLTDQHWDLAAEAYARAARMVPGSMKRPILGVLGAVEIWLELGQREQALGLLSEVVEARPGADADPLAVEYAARLLDADRAAEARDVLRARAAKRPKNPEIVWWMTAAEIRSGAAFESALRRARALPFPDSPSAALLNGRSRAYIAAIATVASTLDRPYPATDQKTGRTIFMSRMNSLRQARRLAEELKHGGRADGSLQTRAASMLFDLYLKEIRHLVDAPPPTDLESPAQVALWRGGMADEIYKSANYLAEQATIAVDQAQVDGLPHPALRRVAQIGHIASCHTSPESPLPYGPIRSPVTPIVPRLLAGDLAVAAGMESPGLALVWLKQRWGERELSAAEHTMFGVLEFQAGYEDVAVEQWARGRSKGSIEANCNLAIAALRYGMVELGMAMLDECAEGRPGDPEVQRWQTLAKQQSNPAILLHCPNPSPLNPGWSQAKTDSLDDN